MNKPNNKVEEIVKEFINRFGADKIWVVPSRDNVETILEIEQFIRQALNSSYEQGVRDERERALKRIDKMKDGIQEDTPFKHGYRTALVDAYNSIR